MAKQKYYNDILAMELPDIPSQYSYYFMTKTQKISDDVDLPYATLVCSTEPFYAKNVSEKFRNATIYSINNEYIKYTCEDSESNWVLSLTGGINYSGIADKDLRRWNNHEIIDKSTLKIFYEASPILDVDQALIIDNDFWEGVIAAQLIRPYLYTPNSGGDSA